MSDKCMSDKYYNCIYKRIDDIVESGLATYRSLLSCFVDIHIWKEVEDDVGFSIALVSCQRNPNNYGILVHKWDREDLSKELDLGDYYYIAYKMFRNIFWSSDKYVLSNYLHTKEKWEFTKDYYNGEQVYNDFRLAFNNKMNISPLSGFSTDELLDEIRSRIKGS